MVWKKIVFTVFLVAVLALGFSSFAFAQSPGSGAVVCYKDYFGKEACVSASKVKWQGGGFVIIDNPDAEIQTAPTLTENSISSRARVSIVYYGDLQYSGIAAIDSLLQRLKKDYRENVTIEFLQDPSVGVVLYAQEVSEASECARDQGKFEEFKEKIFGEKGQGQDKCTLEKHAFEIGLDLEKFKACVGSGEKKAVLEEHKEKIALFSAPSWSSVVINEQPLLDSYEYDAYTGVVNGILTNTPYDIRMPTRYSDQKPFPFERRNSPRVKHTPVIEKAVANAMDFYDEQGKTDEKLHLKVYLIASQLKAEADFQKLQVIVENERKGVVESIDKNNYILRTSMPISEIDTFSAVDRVEKISFDENHAIPSIPLKIIKCPVLTAGPSITPTLEINDKEKATEAKKVEQPKDSPASASVKTLEIKLSLGEDKTAVVSSSNGIAHIESKGVSAVVENSQSISFDDRGLNLDGQAIGILPDEAVNTISSKEGALEVQQMELHSVLFKPVYEVSGEKSGKILGLVSVDYPVKVVVNANDGAIESTQKPWWSFLAD